MSDVPAVEVRDLAKTYRIGFFRKRVEALRGVSFQVHRGEVFGLLGPNGAGKTTTIKSILRLIFPTRGEVRLFGEPVRREAMERVGYMPENPYVYQYLKAPEFLDLCGSLAGLSRKERRTRTDELIERVGLAHATDRPIRKFSKGMMQRVGLAQALLHDPEVLILDEPMSGLDPIGRKEIRDLLMEQRAAGKTLIFTSHILSDVEFLCDRVVILRRGKLAAEGDLADLLRDDSATVEIELSGGEGLHDALAPLEVSLTQREALTLVTAAEASHREVLRVAIETGANVVSVRPHRRTLESLFVEEAVEEAAGGEKSPPAGA
ncbi:MAG: ABC transporter ATP-binding protein [Myxococcota bacterium]